MAWSRIPIGLAVVLAAIQLVPVARTNPPVTSTLPAPPEVERILRRACFDCHSNETVWPLQAYVAPASWLLVHDVKEGREALNFSEWSPEEQQAAAKNLVKEIEKGEMPPLLYVVAHPGARLGKDDRVLLTNWARGL